MTVVMIFLPTIALAETLVIATSLWPPYVVEEKGKLTGIDVEVVRELCRRLAIKSDIRVYPWKRALRYMEKGEADALFAPRRTPEREKFMYYPSEPIHMEKTVLIVPKGSGITITKLDDLKNRIVGVVRGYSYDPEFDKYPHMEKSVCDDDEQLVKMFVHKRISIIAGADEGSLRYLCKKAGVEVEVAYVFSAIPSYIAFSKKATGERGKILAEKFGEALRELKKSDFIPKVESKYF
jgi:polar amino acid transport system substrate-binding protein